MMPHGLTGRRPILDWERLQRSRAIPALGIILAATATKLAVFALLDRPWGCDCGSLWAMPGDPGLNSQVMLDPYSLMHLVFGALLVGVLTRVRPHWSVWTLTAVVVAGSTVWEVVENMPLSIRLFNYDAGDPLAYQGDSRLNALADTASAAVGGLITLRLGMGMVLALAVAVELALSVWIGDGFVIATARALGQLG